VINIKNGDLTRLAIHRVGSSVESENLVLAQETINLSDPALKGILQKYFLSGFKEPTYYNLSHESDIKLNEVFHFCTEIFTDPEKLFLSSLELARHLHATSDHPNIKTGDVCIAYIENLEVNGAYTEAIGIFKIENKNNFLKIASDFSVNYDEGINIEKLDKGCLIFNTEAEKGYFVAIEDHTNRGSDAVYWKNKFLKAIPRQDDYFHTSNYMQLCKSFCTEVLDKKEQVEKVDQIDFLNRSADFFAKKETFVATDFESEVIAAPHIIDQFRGYKEDFREKQDLPIYDEFSINADAVKGGKKVYKSILKLDKNFHIYIHGNRNLIEKGFDGEKGMHYYKVYFKEEKS